MRARDRTHVNAAFTVVELIVVIGCIGLLAGLLLPAIQNAREAARKVQCGNQLRQITLATLGYQQIYNVLPSGYHGGFEEHLDDKRWGWGVFIMPFMEQANLYNELSISDNSLFTSVYDPARQLLLQKNVSIYNCPSDANQELANRNRDFSGPTSNSSQFNSSATFNALHLNHLGFRAAGSNYVANFGDFWNPYYALWTDDELRGTGIMGCQTSVRFIDITDGLANTLAFGERDHQRLAAVWSGVEAWNQCTAQGVSMVLAAAYKPINAKPTEYPYTCDGGGATGFASKHFSGANFSFCDGSIRFLSEDTESIIPPTRQRVPTEPGVLQRLARINDGSTVPLDQL